MNILIKAIGEKVGFEVNCICGKKHFATKSATTENQNRIDNIREQMLKGVRGYVLNENANLIGYVSLFDQNFVVGCDCRSIDELAYQLSKYKKPIQAYFEKLDSGDEEKNGIDTTS